MAIIANFKVSGCTVDKYEAVLRELDAIGVGAAPKGQLFHVCYGSHDNLQVVDVFDSAASLDSFGKSLGPILAKHGITAVPEVNDVYKIMKD